MRDEELVRHKKKAVRHKRFGIEHWSNWFKKWQCRSWYATEKARDEAFKSLPHRLIHLQGTEYDTLHRKVNR